MTTKASQTLPQPGPAQPLPSPAAIGTIGRGVQPPLAALTAQSATADFSAEPSFYSAFTVVEAPDHLRRRRRPEL